MPIEPLKLTPPLVALVLFLLALLGAIGLTYVAALVRFVKRQPLLPDRPRRIVPWGITSIGILIVLWLGVQYGAVRVFVSVKSAANPVPPVAGKVEGGKKATARLVTARDQIVLMAVSSLFLIPLVPMSLRATSQARAEDLGLRKFRFSDVAFGVMSCLLLLPVTMSLMVLLALFIKPQQHLVMEALRNDHSGVMAMFALFTAVVAAPILEELFFRGVFLGWLTNLTVGNSSAGTDSGRLGSNESEPIVDFETEPEPENPYLAPHTSLENPYAEPESSEFADSGWSSRGVWRDCRMRGRFRTW